MKELTNYRRAVQYLQKVFNLVNAEYFNNELPEVTLTVQESTGSYAHVSISNTWFTVDGKGMKELNISACYLTRPIEEVVASLIHECSHIYNMEHGIKDCSGYYHNRRFKETAENLGKLRIEKHEKYGWTITYPTEDTINFCIENGLEDIKIGRQSAFSFGGFSGGTQGNGTKTIKPTSPKKRSGYYRWICPCCGTIIRSTKENINIQCGDCNERFILA